MVGVFCGIDYHANIIVDCEGNECKSAFDDNTDDEDLIDDVLLLNEGDIPGASLEGKDPSELNMVQLKRWLACRGAPVNGNKPELIQRYVCAVIMV